MLEAIKKALKAVWNFIKKIFLKKLNFIKNIMGWFKDPDRLEKLQENKDKYLAISIKENLDNGNYKVVNCLFDKEECELVDYQEDTISIEAENLDATTKKQFGEKEMIVLK